MDEETLKRLVLTDATKGPDDVAPIEHIEYDEKEGADDGGNR